MKIAIILNGISRKKKTFYKRTYPPLAREFDVKVFETLFSGHAEELAAEAVVNQYDVVIAAGGDGTLHQVTNGILKNESIQLPVLGVIPLGTGNDFARTCKLFPKGRPVLQLLKEWQPKSTDIGRIVCQNKNLESTTRHFINVCSVGMGPEVVRRLVRSSRKWGPMLTYYTSIVSTFFSHRPQEINFNTSSWEWKGKARVIAIANGNSFGNQMYVAPDAAIDDGLFNSFVAGELPLWKFLLYLMQIKGNKKIDDPMIHYHSLREVTLSSKEPCPVEGDGEIEGYLPATITIQPQKIRFLR
jgi:diacylglycerol kinase (ATP)